MSDFGILSSVAGLFLLACLSPGPVWAVIAATAFSASRRAAVLVGLGVAGATLTWAGVTMLGLGGLLARFAWLHTALRLAAAGYLVWLGVRMVLGARNGSATVPRLAAASVGGWAALRRGYATSIGNPKAAAFFGSIFMLALPADAPARLGIAAVLLLGTLSAAWHCGLAVVLSSGAVRARYQRAKRWMDLAVGTLMVGLGLRLATTR